MEKQVIIGILAIVAISIVAVMFDDASITGLNAYGYASKLYGPGLKNAFKTPQVLGKAYSQALEIQRSQQYMLAHKDKWKCGFNTADGPFPCMYDDDKKNWCCLFPDGVNSNAFAPAPIIGAKYPTNNMKPPEVRPETKLTGIAGKN